MLFNRHTSLILLLVFWIKTVTAIRYQNLIFVEILVEKYSLYMIKNISSNGMRQTVVDYIRTRKSSRALIDCVKTNVKKIKPVSIWPPNSPNINAKRDVIGSSDELRVKKWVDSFHDSFEFLENLTDKRAAVGSKIEHINYQTEPKVSFGKSFDVPKSSLDFVHLWPNQLLSDEYKETIHSRDENSQEQDWDVIVFTQQWPVTTCYHWREDDKSHACTLPTIKEFWTIHGIWPTKSGHFGPNFCNKTAVFNIEELQTIENRLKEFWPDIDGESSFDWLWKHEWLKHGTCAAFLEELDDEIKYFGQGLKWRGEYSIASILGNSNIHPDSNNTVIALQTALLKGLNGKNPSIHCLYDSKHDVSYLSEIRICFNKTLDLINCDGVKLVDAVQIVYPGGTVITNCHISKPIHYPSLVPPVQGQTNAEKSKLPIVKIYKMLQFIMWFTL